jgi:hypothetical protein
MDLAGTMNQSAPDAFLNGGAALEREVDADPIQRTGVVQANAVVQRQMNAEEIIALLRKKLATSESLTEEEQAEILSFLKKTPRAAAASRRIRVLLQTVPLEEGSELYVLIHGAPGKKPPPKKKTRRPRKPKRKRESDSESSSHEKFSKPIFSDSESEVSEAGEFDLGEYNLEAPEVFGPSMRHSREEQPPDSMDASNTNMTIFLGEALVPRTTGKTAKLNQGAHRKRKTRVRKRLKSEKDDLRGLQESYHWGSHLHVEQGAHFDPAKKKVRESIGSEEDESIHRLLTYTLPKFAQKDSEGHAEQSFLRSEAWVSLQKKLLASLKEFTGSTLTDNPDSGMEMTLVLNRSSCIECGRAMAISTIHFWMQVAMAFKLGSWRKAMEKYKHVITFTARFPTIYEHKKERKAGFKNITSILRGLIDAGWTIKPFEPLTESGMASYKDLVNLVKEIKPDEDSSEGPKGAKGKKKKAARKGSKAKGEKTKGKKGAIKGSKVKGKGAKEKEEDSGDEDAPPIPSGARVDTGALQAFLAGINAHWATPFAHGGGGSGGPGGSGGYMASQIGARHSFALPHSVSERRETLALKDHGLRALRNSGAGALCFVYSVIMGLTGESAEAVRDTVNYVARRAGAVGGWITSDSATASNAIAEIEALFGTQIDVVVIQYGSGGPIIAGRNGHFGQHTVVIRQTPGHYDAYVP